MELYKGDCLELMKNIPDGSVDMVLCDLPYGNTNATWDKKVPLPLLWEQYKRICKGNAAILLFSQQPFGSELIFSNKKMFRYEIIWEKTNPGGMFNANKMPLRNHENIMVFYKKLPKYNPIKTILPADKGGKRGRMRTNPARPAGIYGADKGNTWTEDGTRYPTDVIKFSNQNGVYYGNSQNAVKHPAQKPIPLLEYLIKTYTNEGDLILDNCMGSGSTGVACVNTGRDFIGIELDEHFYQIACDRIGQAQEQIKLPLEKTPKPKEYTKMQLDFSDLIV